MDSNSPTTADYAWSDAQDSLRRVRALEERMERIERQIKLLLEARKEQSK